MANDAEFYKLLNAIGTLTLRKQRLRARIYALCGIIVFPVCIGLAVLLTSPGRHSNIMLAAIFAGSALCFGVGEGVARRRIPHLVEEVANEVGVPVEKLRAEVEHVESAGVGGRQP